MKNNDEPTFFDIIGCAFLLSIIGSISFLLGSLFVSAILYLSAFIVPIFKIVSGLFIFICIVLLLIFITSDR